MISAQASLWGIVLAGGEGIWHKPFSLQRVGSEAVRPFCAFIGDRTLLERTVRRAALLIPPEQIVVIGTASHSRDLFLSLGKRPPNSVLVQPLNRGTGPGILLSLVHILRKNPQALVAILPADHFILPGRRFMQTVAQAADFIAQTGSDLPILLAVEPTHPDTRYGWIKPGPPISLHANELIYGIKQFVEKPPHDAAVAMLRRCWLWNTMVIVARASSLMTLIRETVPRLTEYFTVIQRYAGERWEHEIVREVYRAIPSINFSTAVLARRFERFAVLPVKRIHWSDWGHEDRMLHTIHDLGLSWVKSAQPSTTSTETPHGAAIPNHAGLNAPTQLQRFIGPAAHIPKTR